MARDCPSHTYYVLLRRTSRRGRHRVLTRSVQLGAQQSSRILDVLNLPFDVTYKYWKDHAPRLPRLLTPRSAVYNLESKQLAYPLSFAPPTLFLWEKVGAWSPFRKKATHALHFFIDIDAPLSSIGLTQILSIVCGMATTRTDKRIQGLGYILTSDGVMGTMLCRANQLDLRTMPASMYLSPLEHMKVNNREFMAACFPDTCEYMCTDLYISRCLKFSRVLGFTDNERA
ncbi:hypothetical protein HYDPIDRAFT_34645 [Hydnomerulius pinastri MD-312]|uniref:Uncharacterized protein n=1 Tax=Hydnomerulius pinastri MD-312 TaxID=994086 RepID=A0A0C9VKC1_9AGAM|nr:hypothetical protein HYDPIDRAFT_34645 [Hydnomerulius pinastri MD-312]